MNSRIKNLLGIVLMCFMIVLAVVVIRYESAYRSSQPAARSFSASGEGRVIAVPDIAQLSLSVITEGGKNLTDLQQNNNAKMKAITDFLKSHDIADADIQTQSYSIDPRYHYFSCPPPKEDGQSLPCPPPEITGYTISQRLMVKVRDVDAIGDLISGSVEKGVNNVSGPNFTIDDPTALKQEALAQALLKAQQKARMISETAGHSLGRLISIDEQESPSFDNGPEFMVAMGGTFDAKAQETVQEGSQEVRASVVLTYEIE